MPLPEYAHVEAELHDCGLHLEAAEYHGTLCAFLCASTQPNLLQWHQQVVGEIVAKDGADGDALAAITQRLERPDSALGELFVISAEQMDDAELGFRLLLPDDSEALDSRTRALADWCTGFLFGLTASGLRNFAGLSPELRDIIRDFVEISRIRQEAGKATEEEEAAYAEVSEYVRMGALFFWSELRENNPDPDGARVVH